MVNLEEAVKASYIWTVKERRNGIWIPVLTRKNLMTQYGLTALASAPMGAYTPPQYIVIDTSSTYVTAATSAGATTLPVNAQIDQAGDTQLVVDPGGANQETVTFSAYAAGNYTVAAMQFAHAQNVRVARMVRNTDTMTSVVSEAQYDAVNFPSKRMPMAAWYSPGTAQATAQFYFTATQATVRFMTVGLSENPSVGAGNLHNHLVLGYDHSAGGNDVEIDVALTLS